MRYKVVFVYNGKIREITMDMMKKKKLIFLRKNISVWGIMM